MVCSANFGVSEGILQKAVGQTNSAVYPEMLLYARRKLSKHRCCFSRANIIVRCRIDSWGLLVVGVVRTDGYLVDEGGYGPDVEGYISFREGDRVGECNKSNTRKIVVDVWRDSFRCRWNACRYIHSTGLWSETALKWHAQGDAGEWQRER